MSDGDGTGATDPVEFEEEDDDLEYSLSERVGDAIDWVRFSAIEHWVWVASALVVGSAAIVGVWQLLPGSDVDSARWTLSAMVQATAAIFGTTFVGLVFLWTEGERSIDRLRSLRRDYVELLSSTPVRVVEEIDDGTQNSYFITELEHYRRRLLRMLKTEKVSDMKGWIEYTRYESPEECIYDVTVLRRVVETHRNPRNEEVAFRTASDLEEIGLSENEVLDVVLHDHEVSRDPVEFFKLVSRVFDLLSMVPNAADKRTVEFRDEMWERTELDEIPSLLNRIARMRSLRGSTVRFAIVALTAAIAWGLVILVGYEDSTPKWVLALPIAAGLLGTALIAGLVGRLLTTE